MFCFDIGTIRLACSLAVHYEKQQEQSEDKPHKGKTSIRSEIINFLISAFYTKTIINTALFLFFDIAFIDTRILKSTNHDFLYQQHFSSLHNLY